MAEWKKARKKPVIIEFREPIPNITEHDSKTGDIIGHVELINTLEGKMIARPNHDYVIKGIAGELYPIDKAIFNATYDVQE